MPDILTTQSADSTSGTHDRIVATYELTRNRWSTFRDEALRNYRFVIGDQFDDKVKELLRQEKRPALVWNLIQSKVIYLAGVLEQNRPYMMAVPVNEGDEALAEMHTRLVMDWAMKNCNGMRELTKAGIDAAIGRIGWTSNYWSTAGNPEGEWVTECADPFMLMFDPDAKKADQSDWRYLIYSGFYSAEEIVATYRRDLAEAQVSAIFEADKRITGSIRDENNKKRPLGWMDRVWSGVTDFWNQNVTGRRSTYDEPAGSDYVDAQLGRYRVIEFHDKRSVVERTLYNPATRETRPAPPQRIDETDEQYDKRVGDAMALAPLLTGQQWIVKKEVKEETWLCAIAPGLLPGEVLFEQPYHEKLQGQGFMHKPVFAYDFHPDITKMQSVVDVLIDPQSSYNQRRLTFLEWLMNAVNPDIEAPVGSISDQDLPTWESRERGKIRWFNVSQGMKPEPRHPLAEASSLKVFADEDREVTDVLSNITPAAIGYSENAGESGKLYRAKVQQSMTALNYFMGNVGASMKEVFQFCDASLQAYMTMPRKVRLLNKQNKPEWLPLNMATLMGVHNDVSQGEFDWQVDVTQIGETMRQIKFAEAMEFVQVLASINPALVHVLPLFDLWESPVSDEMKQYAAQVLGMQQQIAGQQAAAQLIGQRSEAISGAGNAVSALNAAATGGLPPPEGGGMVQAE